MLVDQTKMINLTVTMNAATKDAKTCSHVEDGLDIREPALKNVLKTVASNYECSACVLALRRSTHIHVLAICSAGRVVFDKHVPLIDEDEFQLFHHHLRRPLPTIINNTMNDERLKANAFVAGDPHVRFYAAAPIVFSGQDCHGTLCIVDEKARSRFSLKETGFLRDSAAHVARILELQGTDREDNGETEKS
eukprot:TRINITY_DN22058_c0_g1_i1.p1 TRINITY_DN22058_c0_g1~~TRINITY_DN22058_c0_g1_i1.p1  ORF type:complete len:192 (-),score=26.02 TRINITY_DN22058_c0_g1_i1:388-963(-)